MSDPAGTRLAPVYCRDESYKLGWISGFYGCSANSFTSPSSTAAQFAVGFDDGLLEREQRSDQR